ncbi:F-box domain-containing protein [Dioscorea alata]|uniref:F-box domain-containing protein n=1 Tax=Dioscorea alata TaxID=55571 RepID=A0ACB7U7S5_DIOAL|nr:F-box domain-containing protein [Dioscorea alata]
MIHKFQLQRNIVTPVNGEPMASSALPPLVPFFPDEISIQILARLPRSSHSTLSLVSRSWRSILHSPLLVALRSSLHLSSPLLLLNVRTHSGSSLWFSVDPLPNPNPNLNPLPSPSLPVSGAATATLGHELYLLGGSLNGIPSAVVQIFDAASRRWSLGPRMSTGREFSAAAALNGRIYAAGGCTPSASTWAEVLHPGGGGWDMVPSPSEVRERWMHGCAVIGGRILAVVDRGGVVFDVEVGKWGPVPKKLDLGWRGRAAVVGGLLFTYDYLGKIRGYDLEADQWLTVGGVEKWLPRFLHGATLANYGGLLCLVWESRAPRKDMEIMCAGMRISRTEAKELVGEILWKEQLVLGVPKRSSIAHCVTVDL